MPDAGEGLGTADPLWPDAIAWVDGLRGQDPSILLYPISRLQRRFMLGYARTCALVAALARDQHWMIEFAADGSRYARLPARP